MKHRLDIQDIQCGANHSLALDVQGHVYSFGENEYGQCGQCVDFDFIFEPMLIEALQQYCVDMIQCGPQQSYCRTTCGKHFMFGYNGNGECLVSGDEIEECVSVLVPHRIDTLVIKQCCSFIGGVWLGSSRTFIKCAI